MINAMNDIAPPIGMEDPGPMVGRGVRVIRYNPDQSVRAVEYYDAGSDDRNRRVDRLLSLADNADFKAFPKIATAARKLISELCGGGGCRPLWIVDVDIDALNVAMGEADKKRVEEVYRPTTKYLKQLKDKERAQAKTYATDATKYERKVDELLAADPPYRVNDEGRRDRWTKHSVADKLGWDKSAADLRFKKAAPLFKRALDKLALAPKPSDVSGARRLTT